VSINRKEDGFGKFLSDSEVLRRNRFLTKKEDNNSNTLS